MTKAPPQTPVLPETAAVCGPPAGRRDAIRNYHRIIDAAREVLGESGADASMEEIATRAGVGVGTVYRRFAGKDALIDELLRLVMEEIFAAAEQALARTDGQGLHEFVRAVGQCLADHARYANLFLAHRAGAVSDASSRSRAVIRELTARAAAAGTIEESVTFDDVMALVWALRGIASVGEDDDAPADWQRFLDIHLAGMRTPQPPAA